VQTQSFIYYRAQQLGVIWQRRLKLFPKLSDKFRVFGKVIEYVGYYGGRGITTCDNHNTRVTVQPSETRSQISEYTSDHITQVGGIPPLYLGSIFDTLLFF
jgi:hypothetical protein